MSKDVKTKWKHFSTKCLDETRRSSDGTVQRDRTYFSGARGEGGFQTGRTHGHGVLLVDICGTSIRFGVHHVQIELGKDMESDVDSSESQKLEVMRSKSMSQL